MFSTSTYFDTPQFLPQSHLKISLHIMYSKTLDMLILLFIYVTFRQVASPAAVLGAQF